MIEQWQAQIKEASARGQKLVLRGSGTKDGMGEFESAASGVPFATRDYAGIIAYEPNELVISVKCGTPLSDVEKTMREAGQMLSFEAPYAQAGATMGGVVASGLSGPRRPYVGAVRDFVLGVKLIDGKGDHLAFGGQVMKNVAGFDVSRLQCGAWGTLGLITEMSFKCLPLPKAEITLVFEMAANEALEKMNAWAALPLPLSGACWVDGVLRVRLSGAQAAVKSAKEKLGGQARDDATFWADLRDQRLPFFARGDAPLWRFSVRSTAPLRDDNTLLDWGGAQRYARVPVTQHEGLRAWCAQHGGHATLLCQGAHQVARFHPLPAPLLAIHQRLKAQFDPYNIFNIGRMHADF
jgi:glycolate oxidase FAD binding subunit